MDFRPTGERNAENFILDLFFNDSTNKDIANIVLGYDLEAAEKILEQGLDAKRLQMARINGGNQRRLNGSNLSHNLLYFSVRKETVAMLRLMRFSGWKEWFSRCIAESLFPNMIFYPVGFFSGELNGYNLFNGIYMNLTHFSIILSNLYNSANQKIAVLCLDWQYEFYEKMLTKYTIPENCY